MNNASTHKNETDERERYIEKTQKGKKGKKH